MTTIAGEEHDGRTACFTCAHVLAGEPMEMVYRDEDGDWQFLCGQAVHETCEARLITLEEAVALDRRLTALPHLDPGKSFLIASAMRSGG